MQNTMSSTDNLWKILMENAPNTSIRIIVDVGQQQVERIAIKERQGAGEWLPVERPFRTTDVAMLRAASTVVRSFASGVTDFDDLIERSKKKKSKRVPRNKKFKSKDRP